MSPSQEFEVVVVGAGVAGLVTAVRLQRAGVRTLLIEERNWVGGLLAKTSLGGLEVDAGAESYATRNNAVAELISELGIDLTVATPNAAGAMLAAKGRSGVRRAPLPKGTILGIPGRPWARDVRRSIGVAGAFRASLDGVLPPRFGDNHARLGVLVERRMGRRVRELVDAVCRSVYSTPAKDVDIDLVAPALRAGVLRSGSLARAVRSIAYGGRPGSAVKGLEGGLWQLAPALAEVFQASGGQMWTGASARSITHSSVSRIDVVVGVHDTQEWVRAGHVVLAVPGPAAVKLLASVDPKLSAVLGGVPFRGVTVACVRLTSPKLDGNPVGTGIIVAEGVGSRAKALTHMNAKWAWFASLLGPHDHILRLSFDGTSAATVAIAADRDEVARELTILTGVVINGAEISDLTVSTWPDAVVPLVAGAGRPLSAESLEAELRGITCVGSWVAGTGLAAVIPHARSAAGRIIRSNRNHSTAGSRERES